MTGASAQARPEDWLTALEYSPENSVAILVGSSRFPRDPENLPDLPAVVANIIDFERLLRDASVAGLPASRVHRLLDEKDPVLVSERVAEWSDEAKDLLLFYY